MPGVVDRMELRKVPTEADDDSTNSLDDHYTEPIDSEKGTINRSATMMSGFLFPSPNELVQYLDIVTFTLCIFLSVHSLWTFWVQNLLSLCELQATFCEAIQEVKRKTNCCLNLMLPSKSSLWGPGWCLGTSKDVKNSRTFSSFICHQYLIIG